MAQRRVLGPREVAVPTELIGKWLTPPVDPWRVILTAALPFWAYLTLHDIIVYESYVLGGMPREAIAPPLVRTMQHLLLPIGLLAYRLAWRVGWPERGKAIAIAWHILLALRSARAKHPGGTLEENPLEK